MFGLHEDAAVLTCGIELQAEYGTPLTERASSRLVWKGHSFEGVARLHVTTGGTIARGALFFDAGEAVAEFVPRLNTRQVQSGQWVELTYNLTLGGDEDTLRFSVPAPASPS